mgnify:CR=1 FL=1
MSFSDWINLSNDYSMVEMAIPSAWVGKTLRELDLRNKYGMNIAGIRINNHMNLQFSPDGKTTKKICRCMSFGKDKDLQHFNG